MFSVASVSSRNLGGGGEGEMWTSHVMSVSATLKLELSSRTHNQRSSEAATHFPGVPW